MKRECVHDGQNLTVCSLFVRVSNTLIINGVYSIILSLRNRNEHRQISVYSNGITAFSNILD